MHTYFFWAGAVLITVAVCLWEWNPKLPSERGVDHGTVR